jgi:oxaloacetate decarboxylase alpha subunit
VNRIRFVDTTLRDGHQSLWALRMRTGMMLPIAERMDAAGFESIELTTAVYFRIAIRDLKEDPFAMIRLMAGRITKTPLRLIASRINVFGYDPPSMYRLFLERCVANGLKEIRISDPWNDLEGWRRRAALARSVGLTPLLNIIYSVSPRHGDDYYAERTRQAASVGVFRLCLKDPGGLLTPERARTLVPIVLANAGDTPVELHTHCTTGLGPLVALEAIKAGVRIVNTGLPPLADGSALPSLFNVARNARALGFEPDIDEEVLRPVSEHFNTIARREGLPIGAPVEYDYAQYLHQVPGGMISNLANQLRLVGLDHRLAEALEETIRVRAEWGYPVMVTPLSQFVGSQAAINVILGERYKEVTDQTIGYALGYHGAEGAATMDPAVKAKILDRPRAKQLAALEFPDQSVEQTRAKLGGPDTGDDELLMRWFTSPQDVAAMRAAGPPCDYANAVRPLSALIDALSRRTDCSSIRVQKPGFTLTLEKRTVP